MSIFKQDHKKMEEKSTISGEHLSTDRISEFRNTLSKEIEYYTKKSAEYAVDAKVRQQLLDAIDIGLKTITTKENNNEK